MSLEVYYKYNYESCNKLKKLQGGKYLCLSITDQVAMAIATLVTDEEEYDSEAEYREAVHA